MGDELMITGRARKLNEANGRKVIVLDRTGAMRAHEVWRGNPRIATRADKLVGEMHIINDGPGMRAYIATKTWRQWGWRAGTQHPGELYFDEFEMAYAAGLGKLGVVVEPNVKDKASPNKRWRGWQTLVNMLDTAGLEPTQLGPAGTQVLAGVRFIETPSFRHACAALRQAHAAVLPEGGLHHAAAAVGTPAVVIFGGYISPAVTGYPGQAAIYRAEGLGCGMRIPCDHCSAIMKSITPADVFAELVNLLKEKGA